MKNKQWMLSTCPTRQILTVFRGYSRSVETTVQRLALRMSCGSQAHNECRRVRRASLRDVPQISRRTVLGHQGRGYPVASGTEGVAGRMRGPRSFSTNDDKWARSIDDTQTSSVEGLRGGTAARF